MTNILALGGAADMHPHVPTKVGQVGTAVFWESTGAADALPFWNTNFRCDVLLFYLMPVVRVEFKEWRARRPTAATTGRSGDMMLLPKDIAHRTFSGNGKRRISLEIIEHDPAGTRWLGRPSVAADPARPRWARLLTGARSTEVSLDGSHGGGRLLIPPPRRRALVAYGLHLGHNEFEGGFVVRDEPPGAAPAGGPAGEAGDAAGGPAGGDDATRRP